MCYPVPEAEGKMKIVGLVMQQQDPDVRKKAESREGIGLAPHNQFEGAL